MSYHLSNLIPVSILGHGKFSDVVLSKSYSSNDLYAVKIINRKKDTVFNTYTNFENELSIITILSSYHNPNILSTYSIISTGRLVYILNEYCEQGELTASNFRYYPNNKSELDNIVSKLNNILGGIEFLHSLNIIHRDIKPSNLLLNSAGQVKLSDFDTCYKLSSNFKIDYQNIYNKLIGTPIFLPPEICSPAINGPPPKKQPAKKQPTKMSKKISNLFRNSNSSSSSSTSTNINPNSNSNPNSDPNSTVNLKSFQPFKLDVWSLGVTLYYLLFSKFPFYSDNEYLLFQKISDEIPFIPANSDYPKPLTSTILKMLAKNPFDRISIKKIITDLNLVIYKANSNNLINKPSIIIKNSDSNDLLYDSIMSNNNSNFATIQLKLPIFQNEFVNKSTSSLPLPLVHPNISDNINNDPVSEDKNNNRNSIMTLPPNLNRSKSKLKHSSKINFRKYLPKDNKERVDDIDYQLAKDYKIYTMDDYLDDLN